MATKTWAEIKAARLSLERIEQSKREAQAELDAVELRRIAASAPVEKPRDDDS